MKKLLSIVLSIALLLMVVPFGVLTVSAETESSDKITVTWDVANKGFSMNTEDLFQESLGENDGTGAVDDPYIITTAEQFAYVANYAGANSAGKYYKVADNIGAFDFTSFGKDLTAAEVETAYQASAWQGKWYENANNYAFQGTFDGNGAIFYGVDGKSWQTGLFPRTNGATIKNLTVQASRFNTTGNAGAGAIVGKADTSITITNCVVKNCYITSGGTAPLGTVVGSLSNFCIINVSNCLVMNNIVTESTAYPYGGISSGSNYYHTGDYNYSNIITIGNTPYATLPASPSYQSANVNTASNYTNIYTDQTVDATYTGITTLTTEQMKGSAARDNMLNLDWSAWIAFDGEYPDLRSNHTLSITKYDDDGHTISCSDCGKSLVEAHVLVENNHGTFNECVCGYSEAITEKKIVEWAGATPKTLAESGMTGSGTQSDPYVIKTADQLWYVAQAAGDETAGKYYMVAANIKAFDMNQQYWGLNSSTTYFQGIFDGNGVEITDFKASGWFAGLFPRIAGDVVIKNLKISGAVVTSGGDSAGAIVGSIGTTANATISNCVVVDSTISAPCAAGAIIGSAGAQALVVENCFVANNTVDANTKEADTEEYKDNAVIGYGHTSTRTMNNTIAIGNDPSIRVSTASNVYTDVEVTLSGVTQVSLEDIQGAGVVSKLGFDTSVWFDTASYPELLVFHNVSIVDNGDGTHSMDCSDCELDALTAAHTPGEVVVENENAAECGKAGSYDEVTYCTVCDAVVSRETITIDALEHDYDVTTGVCTICNTPCAHGTDGDAFVWNSNNDGDCLTADHGKFVCSICGFSSPEIENPNFVAGHTPGEVKEENRTESTCTTAGSYDSVTYCSVCGNVASSEKVDLPLDPDNHAFDDAKDTDCNNGCGHVREVYTLGDINDDGEINNRDIALLMQYINGWDVEIPEIAAADVVADGEINNKDYAILMQYINGWEVTLG